MRAGQVPLYVQEEWLRAAPGFPKKAERVRTLRPGLSGLIPFTLPGRMPYKIETLCKCLVL